MSTIMSSLISTLKGGAQAYSSRHHVMRNARLTIVTIVTSLFLTCASTPPPAEAFRQLQSASGLSLQDVLKETTRYAQVAEPRRLPLPLQATHSWGAYVNFTSVTPVIHYRTSTGSTLAAQFKLYQLNVTAHDRITLRTRSWVNHLFASGQNTIVIPAIVLIFPDGRQEFPTDTVQHHTPLINLQGSDAFLDREYQLETPQTGTLNILLLSYGDYPDDTFLVGSARMRPRGPGYIPILFEIGAAFDCLYGSILYSNATASRSPLGRVSIEAEWK